MESASSFGNLNSGLQIGHNYGSIDAHFSLQTDLLDKLPVASGAAFNSYVDQHEDECLPGTRIELLEEIAQWAVSPHGKCIFWLNGMAGTGKSTISRTVARSLQRKFTTVSFFFKRDERDRGNAIRLFPTIARQLGLSIPVLAPMIRHAISQDPDIAARSLAEQFTRLIIRPFFDLEQAAEQATLPIPAVILVIDALDECETDNDIRAILQVLPQVQDLNAVRIRVFLTSRPELPIRLGFSKIADHQYQNLALHEIPETMTTRDISLFLRDRFTKIREIKDVPDDWPGGGDIQVLITMSSPLFISAATVCRFIEANLDPVECLADLLEDQAKYATKMDKTYLPVLLRLSNEDGEEQRLRFFHQIVGVIVLLAEPLSINALSRFLDVQARVVGNLLDSFQSVLSLPSDRNLPVRILHLSFRDFLVQTKSKFSVDRGDNDDFSEFLHDAKRFILKHRQIADIAPLQIYCSGLVFTPERTIIRRQFHKELPVWADQLPKLEQYWSADLQTLEGHSERIESLALSPDGHTLASGSFEDTIRLWDTSTGTLLQIIEGGPQSMTFSPNGRLLACGFRNGTIRLLDTATSALQNTLNCDPLFSASSLAFHPDGQLLACNSGRAVWLWDANTWTLKRTLKGHSDWVQTVAFSPDGQRLASGSSDSSIRLWNTSTWTLTQILQGHSDWVTSLAFSPDGRLLASSCLDNKVNLWDIPSMAVQRTLDSVSETVCSVVFSPDGLLVCGYEYGAIRFWNPATGALQQTLNGHTGQVDALVFALDDRIFASGSHDTTVRLWDTSTIDARKQNFEHSNRVRLVTSSPGGGLLASVSGRTVGLWNTATGDLEKTLSGHPGRIESVVFSPDTQVLASCCDRRSIWLWDISTGAPQHTFESSGISIAFSYDGQLLAFRTWGGPVQVRDTATGALQRTLATRLGGPVTFSPDGQILAFASQNQSVELWDISTWSLRHSLPQTRIEFSMVVFSPDSHLLAVSTTNHCVQLWNTATGALEKTMQSHLGYITSMALSPDNQLLASTCSDHALRIWNVTTSTLQQVIEVDPATTDLHFSLDSSCLTSSLGILKIQPETQTSWFPVTHAQSPGAGFKMLVHDGRWILLHGERVLWLPPEYRPTCSAVSGSTLALGHASGLVSFISFLLD
ncbi:uncharacterized protein N7482_006662 [Penicillium canariense]|uniref:NACHT domain-containing protein n=1 Tax=Penicillium canariense TaxID=189055 RepID=A0A9W9HXK2_9EURO|nr:uncharacterized protein N7482_006662 [Penicillium canariense]KAJ5159658.1 hypothetical protein N7482_006662 [Penicillium canariense]